MEGATPKERPEDLLASFVNAWSQRDADGLAALFTADADFVNVVGLWWRTRRAIRKAHAYGFERIFARSTLTLEQVAVKELGPDVATIHGRWHMEGQVAPDGSEAEPRDGVLILVAQRAPTDGSSRRRRTRTGYPARTASLSPREARAGHHTRVRSGGRASRVARRLAP
jgi:uncharacterized protein (TIGR02246 family)